MEENTGNGQKAPDNMPPVLSLEEYQRKQKEEALSDENKYFAGEKLGHSPNPDEAVLHYANNGGAEHFAETHILKTRV